MWKKLKQKVLEKRLKNAKTSFQKTAYSKLVEKSKDKE